MRLVPNHSAQQTMIAKPRHTSILIRPDFEKNSVKEREENDEADSEDSSFNPFKIDK